MRRYSLPVFRFPIFDKLALIEGRLRAIVKYFSRRYGPAADAVARPHLARLRILSQSVGAERHGSKTAARTFEYIGRQFDRAKIEEARLVCVLLKRFGEDAPRLFATASYEFGKETGLGLSLEKDFLLEDREEIKRFLKFWFHDFVPCEAGFDPCFEACKKILFQHQDCPHRFHWEEAKVPPEVMCDLHSHFLKGFLEAVSAHQIEVKTCRSGRRRDVLNESYEIS